MLNIEKLVHVVYNEVIELWQFGTTVIIDTGSPKQNREIFQLIKERKVVGVGTAEEGITQTTSWRDLVKEYGIDPELPFSVKLKRTPYYYFYMTDDRKIVVSNKALLLGNANVYVRIANRDEIAKIFDSLTHADYYLLMNRLGRELKLKAVFADGTLDYGLLAERTYIAEEHLEDDVLNYFLQPTTWKKVLEKAFPTTVDPFIREFYKGYALPYFNIEYSPHSLIFTNTKAGKTTYGNAVNKAYSDVTAVTLAGGYVKEGRASRPRQGIINRQDVMVQIENLETKSAAETLRYCLEYFTHGIIRRGSGTFEIISYGTAPLVFTGNTLSEKVGEFQNTINLLVSNPEALGSRTIFFYMPDCKPLEVNTKEFNNAWQIIRGVRSNRKLKDKLRKIWNHPKVKEFLTEEVKIPEDVKTNIEALPDDYEFLRTYLENSVKYCSRKLRALALNNVLLDYLPQIWFNNVEEIIEEIIGKAEEKTEVFKGYFLASIGKIVKDSRLVEAGKIIATLPFYVRVVVYAAAKYIQEYGEVLGEEFETTLDNEKIAAYIKEVQERKEKKWSLSMIKKSIKNNILTLQTCSVLKDFGLEFIIVNGNIKIKVKKEALSKIPLSELEQILQLIQT